MEFDKPTKGLWRVNEPKYKGAVGDYYSIVTDDTAIAMTLPILVKGDKEPKVNAYLYGSST